MKFVFIPNEKGQWEKAGVRGTILSATGIATALPVSIAVDETAFRQAAGIVSHAAMEEMRTKRAAEYPPLADLADALVKKASTDPTLQAEGAAQEASYYAACLTVKAKYPKPTP